MKHANLILNLLHFVIRFDYCLRRAEQFFTDLCISWQVLDSLLVAELILQCSPEVHAVGADLNETFFDMDNQMLF